MVDVIPARAVGMPRSAPGPAVEWRLWPGLVEYETALAAMEERVAGIASGAEPEAVWLLQHPPLYTAGTSARPEDLIDPDFLPVFKTGRGGQFTYHGPGQRIAYVVLDLKARRQDIRRYVATLEQWVIDALADLGIAGERRNDRVGVWVKRPDKGPLVEDKIAAIGVRVRRWVTFHGIAVNVAPDLGHYAGIVPCGVRDQGVTSLADLGSPYGMADLDRALLAGFERLFG
jgi:lipoyl(octanoyl) transferase